MCVGIEEKSQYIKGENYVDVPQMCTWATLSLGHEVFWKHKANQMQSLMLSFHHKVGHIGDGMHDVAKKIMSFAQGHGPHVVYVMLANGAISNVTLRQ